jgi:hypothetical protein
MEDFRPSPPSPPLRGAGAQPLALRACQLAWWCALVIVLAMYTLGMPARIEQLVTVTPYNHSFQLNPTQAAYLSNLGIPLPAYFWYVLTLELLTATIYVTVAALIYWRRAAEVGAILVSLLLICYGSTETAFTIGLKNAHPDLTLFARRTLQAAGEWLSLVVFFIFPDGYFVPRWTRGAALAYAVACLLWLLFPELPFNVTSPTFNEWQPWSYLFLVGVHTVGFVALTTRYQRLGEGVERQQIKWAVFGLAFAASASLIRYTVDTFVGAFNLFSSQEEGLVYNTILRPTQWIFLWAFPIGLAFAMLRRRLWAIDPIITRVVVYALLSGLLAATVLASSAILERSLIAELSGVTSLTATVTGVLVVLVAHGRLQRWVDQRFNRRRVDAQNALRCFADELGTYVTPAHVQQILPERLAELLRLEYSTLLMERPGGGYGPVSVYGRAEQPTPLDGPMLADLAQGEVVTRPDTAWPLILPLRAPHVNGSLALIGVLAVGPHRSGRPYDREDVVVLRLLADRAASTLALAASMERERQAGSRAQIINPYRPNRPLPAESPLFVGRRADLVIVAEQLTVGVSVVLTGEHRMGKTTLLQQLPAFLGPACRCVLLDGQRLAVGGNLAALCHEIACTLAEATGQQPPPFTAYQERPDAALLRHALPAARAAAHGRRLILLLDEFEELERRVRDQRLDRAAVGLLRFVMQHEPEITLLLSGSTAPEELGPDLWPNLLNAALHHRLGPLDLDAARQLVIAPLEPNLRYQPEALSQVLALTDGHPYFIHVMCSTLVIRANRHGSRLVTREDVDVATAEAIELAAPHLVSLWHDSSDDERRLLRALADDEPRPVAASELAGRAGLGANRAARALRRLARRGLFATTADGWYRWRLGLFRTWVREVAPDDE